MRILLTILFLYPVFLSAQQLKSMVSSYTYCYDDSTQNVTVDSNLVLIYDKAGRLLRRDNVLDVCYANFKYDEKGRLILEEERCGEGFSIYKYEYAFRKILFTGESTYSFCSGMDSLDEKDRIVYSYKKSRGNGHFGDDTLWYEYFQHYKYDTWGNLIDFEIHDMGDFPYSTHSEYDSKNRIIFEERKLNDGYSRFIEKWSYTEVGNIQSQVLKRIKGSFVDYDSSIFKYDNKYRLTQKIHYSKDDEKSTLTRIDTFTYKYREGKVSEKTMTLNDSIVSKFVKAGKSKSMISHYHVAHSAIGLKNPTKDTYDAVFLYDDKGRITSIHTKSKEGIHGIITEKFVRITYPSKTKTVVEEVEDFEITDEDPYYRCIYENGLLILEQEFGSKGIVAYSKFKYTFYE